MRFNHQLERQRFIQIVAFGRKHPDVFASDPALFGVVGAENAGPQMLEHLENLSGELDLTAALQRRRAAESQTRARDVLVDDIRGEVSAIRKSVGFIAMKRLEPGLLSEFRLNRLHTDALLCQAALAICDAIAELGLEPELLALKHPLGFITLLRTRVAQLQQTKETRAEKIQTRVSATARTTQLVRQGRELVAGLDAIASNALRADPERLAAWTSARHRPRSGVSAAKRTRAAKAAKNSGTPAGSGLANTSAPVHPEPGAATGAARTPVEAPPVIATVITPGILNGREPIPVAAAQ